MLYEGQALVLKEDLDCGLSIIEEGTIFIVKKVGINILLEVEGVGAGLFTEDEVEKYFEIYVEEDEIAKEIQELKCRLSYLEDKIR